MNFETLKNHLPEYAKDTKLNLSSLLSNQEIDGLSAKHIAGVALASAYHTKNRELIEAITDYAKPLLSDADLNGIKIAVSLMAMTNVYYRFVHLSSDNTFGTLPAKLRMNAMANPGIDKVEFDIYALAVSALNACGFCIDAHVKLLLEHQISHEAIQTTIRVASVIHATAQVLAVG